MKYLASLAAIAATVAAKGNLTPITVKGNAFYKGNERFYVRGVAYQPGTHGFATRDWDQY